MDLNIVVRNHYSNNLKQSNSKTDFTRLFGIFAWSFLVCSLHKAVICCTFAMWRCTFKGHVIRQVPILYGFNQRILKKVARHFNYKEIWYAHKSFEMILCLSANFVLLFSHLEKDGVSENSRTIELLRWNIKITMSDRRPNDEGAM